MIKSILAFNELRLIIYFSTVQIRGNVL